MIESEYLPAWSDQGFTPFIVHIGADVANAVRSTKDEALSFPLYLDTDETVYNRFSQTDPETLPFPLAYLIDRNGIVRHVYAGYVEGEISPGSLSSDVEALLAE